MMAVTHAMISAAGASLVLGTAEPLVLALAVLGSQLPDLDTSQSFIGQVCSPVAGWIEARFPHRSVTHSLLATGAIALLSFPLVYVLGGSWLLGAAVPLGHLLACLSDAFTVKGVQLFWPNPVWAISVSNPKRRLTTGGPGEYWVLVGATALLVAGIWVANGGGLLPKVNQSLGLKAGAIATYNQHAASHHVYAHVTGVWTRDRTRADGKYLILGTAGSEFILLDGQGQIHKTGEQLLPSKLATAAGEPARTTIQTVTFNDEPATAKLLQLRSAAGNGLLFLSGELTIDFPEEVELPLQPDRFQTASLVGASLKLEFCSLDQALELLEGQYAIGSVTVRWVRPVPLF